MKATPSTLCCLKLFLAGLVLLTTLGCVISKGPVGETPTKIVPEEWEGTWTNPDGAVLVKVVDADKGILKVFWLDDEEKGDPVIKTSIVELKRSGALLFANASGFQESKGKGYLWVRITKRDRQIAIWWPDHKVFQQLVKDGVFPGKIEDGDVILDELKPEHLTIITSGAKGVLFIWQEPLVFVKLGK